MDHDQFQEWMSGVDRRRDSKCKVCCWGKPKRSEVTEVFRIPSAVLRLQNPGSPLQGMNSSHNLSRKVIKNG